MLKKEGIQAASSQFDWHLGLTVASADDREVEVDGKLL